MTVPPRPRADDDEVSSHEEVALALAALDRLAERPLAEHVAVFERVHAALGRALADGAPAAAEAPDRS
jgi:hypothetical protein